MPIILRVALVCSAKLSEHSFFCFLFNWESLHARLNSHYEAWSSKRVLTNVMKNPLLIVRVILRRWSIKTLIINKQSKTLRQWFLHCRFVKLLLFISIFLVACAIFFAVDLVCYFQIWRDCFRKSCKRMKISKSCYYIKVVAVMVMVQQSFSAVTNPVMMVNDRWPAIFLSATTPVPFHSFLGSVVCALSFFMIIIMLSFLSLCLCHVAPAWSIQHCIGCFFHRSCLLDMGKHSTGYFLK